MLPVKHKKPGRENDFGLNISEIKITTKLVDKLERQSSSDMVVGPSRTRLEKEQDERRENLRIIAKRISASLQDRCSHPTKLSDYTAGTISRVGSKASPDPSLCTEREVSVMILTSESAPDMPLDLDRKMPKDVSRESKKSEPQGKRYEIPAPVHGHQTNRQRTKEILLHPVQLPKDSPRDVKEIKPKKVPAKKKEKRIYIHIRRDSPG